MSKTESETDKVWYFAFGSNMNPKVLTGRRKVTPTQSKPSFVPGWYLNFDVSAIPYIEPSFASIGQKPIHSSQPEVHGVVHEITQKDLARIRRTEGGGGHENIGYDIVQVKVHTYDGDQVTAYTLVEHPKKVFHDKFYPSKRYMELLEVGSVQFGLKPSYQEWLRSVPRYVPIPTARHFIGRLLFLGLVLLFIVPLAVPFVARLIFRGSHRLAPRWTYVMSRWVMYVHGHLYYFVFRPIFGPGAGEPNISTKLK